MNADFYDTQEQIREKLSIIVNVKNPSFINSKDYIINLTLPKVSFETLHDMESYIVELNKRKSGFKIRLMTHKESMTEVENRLAAEMFEIMYSHDLESLQEEAEKAVKFLVESAGYSEEE